MNRDYPPAPYRCEIVCSDDLRVSAELDKTTINISYRLHHIATYENGSRDFSFIRRVPTIGEFIDIIHEYPCELRDDINDGKLASHVLGGIFIFENPQTKDSFVSFAPLNAETLYEQTANAVHYASFGSVIEGEANRAWRDKFVQVAVLDHNGNGYSVLSNNPLVPDVWFNSVRRRTLNRAEAEERVRRICADNRDVVVRWCPTNNLPPDWCNERTKII